MSEQEKWDLLDEAINLFNQQEYEKSLNLFDKSLEIDPSFENAMAYKSFVINDLKSEKESLKYLDNQIKKYNNYKLLYYVKASILREIDAFKESNQCFDRAIQYGLEEDVTWNLKAYNFLGMDDYKNAALFFEKHLKENPADANAWCRLGYCLPFLHKFEEAIECQNRALDLDPEFNLAYFCKGAAFRGMEQYENALECFEKAYSLDPEDGSSILNIKRCLKALGRYEESREYENILKKLSSSTIYLEAQLEEKLLNDPSILKNFGYDVEKIEQQFVIKDIEGKTRFIDLIFRDKADKTIVVELKNIKATMNTYNQIDNYLKSLKNNYDIISQGIVIARGYETDFDDLISLREDIEFIDLEDLGFE